MYRLAILALAVLLTATLAPAQGVVFTVEPEVAPPGQTVLIIFENRNPYPVYLSAMIPPWAVLDASKQRIYIPASLPVSMPVPAYSKAQWAWDQRDNNKKQVPAGTYEVISYYPLVRLSATLTIKDQYLGVVGTPRPGARISLVMSAQKAAGFSYAVALSYSTKPGITLPGNRVFPLTYDFLFVLSRTVGKPLFERFSAKLDKNGQSTAHINIPRIPQLRGTKIYAAFAALDASSPGGVFTFSNAAEIHIQ